MSNLMMLSSDTLIHYKAGLRELGILPFQTERLKTNQHGELEHNFALLNINQADYIRHIVSNCAAARMKHVKQYQNVDLSQYRAGGPVWREYLHDAGIAGKTKATVKGSPVKIREIKRLTNNAISVAGGQYAVYEECPLDPDVRIFLRNVLFRKSSSAKFFGTSLCSRARALSFLRINSLALAFSRTTFRLSSSSDIRLVASVTIEESDFVFWSSIVSSCIAIRRNTSHHGNDSFCMFHRVVEETASYQLGGRDLLHFKRRGYFSIKASSANCFGLVSGGGLSRNLRSWSAFSRCRSIMDNASFCSSSLVIVYLCKAVRRRTLSDRAGGSYPSFREGYVNVFRTNSRINTSDHLSPKAVYTGSIPYKTGIGRRNPFNCEATNDARSVFFSASDLRHINGFVHCAYPCTIQSFHELHFAQRHQQTMVMLAGLPKGRPESLQSGIPTPASVTALCERRNSSGDVIYHCKEAATMATTPTLVHSQTAFIWRFITVGASERQIIHVTAWTEREARNRCPSGCVAVFAAKIRQEASHG
ncbi:host cell division inhibitor Icd-like protein [Escherichia coli]